MDLKEKILKDIATIYAFLERQNKEINKLYEDSSGIDALLKDIFLEIVDDAQTRFACIDRIVGLKETSFLTILQKLEVDEEKTAFLREKILEITCNFHMQKHLETLHFIHKNSFLTPFLRELLESIHRIGIAFNAFFKSWQNRLILEINKDLQKQFNGDLKAILNALESSFEICDIKGEFSQKGEVSDRSYSVPVFCDSAFKALAYAEFFTQEFESLQNAFKQSLESLEKIPEVCEPLEQKEAHLQYLRALQSALMQKDCGKLLESWRLVDKAWMQISTPLQIGHPLEYYEDHFRKAVAPEWDMRIARIYDGKDLLNPNAKSEVKVSKDSILEFYTQYSAHFQTTTHKDSIDSSVKESLLKTQSFGGMPLLFYGAELNGLFSAQVVPNDEKVSAKYGKKIFYFPDRVRELSMSKPFMLLSSKTFCEEFLDFNRALLYFRKEDWYKVYEITTLGHEFGHILWVDFDSELQMNASGQFKNIEEFKATMGGLAYYFTRKDKPLLKEVVCNTISRAVGLIAWQREDEVLPYYCEALIHLQVLFNAGILHYKGSFEEVALEVCVHAESLKALQEEYLKTYDKLIAVYLNKADAKEFLEQFAMKENGYYKPLSKEIYTFVEDYYTQYCQIGQIKDVITAQMWQESYKKKGVNVTAY